MSQPRKLYEWLEEQLNEVRRLADLGTNTVYAEIKLRKAMRRMAEEKFFEFSTPENNYFIAEASLLLGRLIRLRGRHSEAKQWLVSAAAIFSELIRTGTIRNIDSALRCAEHLTLIEKDAAITKGNLLGSIDLQISELALENQYGLLSSTVQSRDYGDHMLEYLQRKAELIDIRYGPSQTLEFLKNSAFYKFSSERPDHNQVLRLLYLCELETEAGNIDQAIRYIDAAGSFPIIRDSAFLQLMLNERKLSIARLSGDLNHAIELQAYVRRLRAIENIQERPQP